MVKRFSIVRTKCNKGRKCKSCSLTYNIISKLMRSHIACKRLDCHIRDTSIVSLLFSAFSGPPLGPRLCQDAPMSLEPSAGGPFEGASRAQFRTKYEYTLCRGVPIHSLLMPVRLLAAKPPPAAFPSTDQGAIRRRRDPAKRRSTHRPWKRRCKGLLEKQRQFQTFFVLLFAILDSDIFYFYLRIALVFSVWIIIAFFN